jgi:lipopolysaccharide heptosyltransferase II
LPDLKRILVVRTDRLGDVVLTLPLLSILRQHHPQAHIAMLTGTYAGELIAGNPFLNELIPYDEGGRLIPFGRIRRMLGEKNFDAAVIVHPTPRLALLAFTARIPIRIGTGYRWYGLLFNRRIFTHRKTAERHEAEYNCELLTPLGCALPKDGQFDFTLKIPESAERAAETLLREIGIAGSGRFAVLHPGSGGSAREWPVESFGHLAAEFVERFGMPVLVTGTASEMHAVESVVRISGGKAMGVAGRLGIKELAALLRRAALVVANSTGPLHIAVAVGTPVLGFYPQIPVMGPRRWGPYTRNARVLVPEKPIDCAECTGVAGTPCACMASISVEAAVRAAGELLELNHAGAVLHGS